MCTETEELIKQLGSWREDKGQRLTFTFVLVWLKQMDNTFGNGTKICMFHHHLCIYLFTLLPFVSALSGFPFKSFSISLQILPPYDPGVIHKGKVVRLGLHLNSDPIVSLGSKHTRTFVNGARVPLCIIVVILILSTATWAATKQSCKQTSHTFKPGAKATIAKVTATTTI